jgi:phage terminase large subunit
MPTTEIPEHEIRISSVYQPWPKQQVFHSSPARFRLFGGAQGPGKSLALLWEGILHCLEYLGSNSLLLRRTYPELDSGLIDHFEKHVLAKCPEIIGGRRNFNRSNRVVNFPNGSKLRFGYCEAFKDVYQYDSAEYVFIGLDELTQFQFRIWEHLRLRNRCPVPGSRPCMAGATNPGGENGEWVKALWIDRKPFPGMESYQYDAKDYDFIPANVFDNPIYANDLEYIKNLQEMSPGLRAQRLEGRWDKFEGQFFTNFDPVRHVWDSRNHPFEIPAWWPKWVAIDWGFAHNTAVKWMTHGVTTAPNTKEPQKLVITYREMLVREKTGDELGKLIADRSAGEHISNIYLSPDAFAKKESVRTIATQLGDALAPRGLPRPAMADNDRVGGWNLMYQLLELDQWMIMDSCVDTIRSLPMLMRDPEKLEDVKKTDSLADDSADADRYGIKTYLNPRKVPEKLVHEANLARIPDLQSKFLYNFEYQNRRGNQTGPIRQKIVPGWMKQR